MGVYEDLIGDKVKFLATMEAHKAEVDALKAKLEVKDATIEGMGQQMEFLREKGQAVETQYQGLKIEVTTLQRNLSGLETNFDRLQVNDVPTTTLLEEATTSGTSVYSSSEGLGDKLTLLKSAWEAMIEQSKNNPEVMEFRIITDDDADPD